ncbi:unnamed protein product [Cuscuta campestris]|uniref:Histidine-containing phosphotransfer protein n=1 Tax=Cuscuta campestris TaxID=132261 RepID=A0A484LQ04_9ASTE|nr:unnamed protein product [Cuscuta campestris]
MDVAQMQKQFLEFVAYLGREGILDGQFAQLHSLQDESNPDFVIEVVSLFFEDSERIINLLAAALQQQVVNFKEADAIAHQFKGSTSSIGAQRVKNACLCMKTMCDAENLDGSLQCLQVIKNEYALVKSQLQILVNLEKQILAAGGTIPMF